MPNFVSFEASVAELANEKNQVLTQSLTQLTWVSQKLKLSLRNLLLRHVAHGLLLAPFTADSLKGHICVDLQDTGLDLSRSNSMDEAGQNLGCRYWVGYIRSCG